jgi:hypothetical protein
MDIENIGLIGIIEVDNDNVGLEIRGAGMLVIPNAAAATLAKALYAKSQRWSEARMREFLAGTDFEIDYKVSH